MLPTSVIKSLKCIATSIIYFLLFICLVCKQDLYGQQKVVALTIDDLPVVIYKDQQMELQQQITDKLLKAMKSGGVKSTGFVNEIKLYGNDKLQAAQVQLLRNWLNDGHDLGNHTFSHMDYHLNSFQSFTNDVINGEPITRELLKEKQKSLLYFRHPYLHIGKTKSAYDSLENFLAKKKYVVAPVSITNEDYLFAAAYAYAIHKGDTSLRRRISRDYLEHMERTLAYDEQLSMKVFQRNIKHILIIHANQINADHLPQLIAMYKKKGYSFIELEEALKDAAYHIPFTVFGEYGISVIDRVALSRGKKGSFFKGDVSAPAYIVDLSNKQ